ncbi:hypothetical protein SAMN04487886_11318 [Clostridium sp. DSM 8431]|nr:hypothetical protein SAMN04487886_11318 [Clostridium sp. DSM 8431]
MVANNAFILKKFKKSIRYFYDRTIESKAALNID